MCNKEENIMEKLKVLLLGAAFAADLHVNAYTRIRDMVEIVGIADLEAGRVRSLAERYGLEGYQAFGDFRDAIAQCDCDLVDICLPSFLHCAPALLALKKGRNVICEKPLATKVEHAREMVECAKENGKYIYYAEDWLFAPAVTKAREIIREGGIGNLQYIRARECHSGSHSPFAQKIEYCGGGALIHLGIHPTALVLAFKNSGWMQTVAMTSSGGENNMRHKEMEGEDWGAALIRFTDGTTAMVEGNCLTCGGMENTIDFYGTTGCLHVDLTFSSAISCFSISGLSYTVEKAEITTGWSRPVVDEKLSLGHPAELKYFVECALQNHSADVGMRGEDGLEALKLMDCIYRSALEGIAVTNPDKRI
jgi:myo-inositol 2-dehydrogenase / D-chiro-inositol 1-dehydrogenase